MATPTAPRSAPLRCVSRRRQKLHPQTGMPLRPGQRLPTRDDQRAAACSLFEPSLAPFPIGQTWELIPEHCGRWQSHNFDGRRGDTNHLRTLGDLADDEWALLLWDLDCHQGMVRRRAAWIRNPVGPPPPCPPPLHEYLRHGREHWGEIGAMLRELREAWDDGEG